jgi:outer membrane receptor protein involved in Fe transport
VFLASASPTVVQAAEAQKAQAAPAAVQEVVVTGSHLRQNGLQSPVPITAVTATELKAMSPSTLIEGVTKLPQFYNSQTPNSGNWFTRGGYGNLDIRGLGINRTLTLLDGRRVISQTAFGGVDVNMFPQELIKRVETVTGGASAAYGTDAVAGVANFFLDTDLQGLRLTGEGGQTSRGDAGNYLISGAYGMKLGDKGHILLASEFFKQDGVFNYKGRNWYQAWGTVPDSTGVLRIVPHVVSKDSTFGGLIFAPGTPLNGLAFKPDGSTYVFQPSALTSGVLGTPPARQSIVGGGSGDDLGGEVATLYPNLKRYSTFAYADYELAHNFTVFVQYLRGNEDTFATNAPRGSIQGTPTQVTIFSGNPFLPANVQQIMTANNIPSFILRRTGSAEDIGADISLRDTSVMNSLTSGFKWDIDSGAGPFNGWQMDGYYQYGHNTRRGYQIGLNLLHMFAAVDAVKDPSGNIVCRTTLFSSTYSDCQPLDLFGKGAASQAAVNYVVGNKPGVPITTPLYFAGVGFAPGITDTYVSQQAKVNTTEMTQHVAEWSMNGEVFRGWGAGPITGAFGASFRREEIFQFVRDSTNQSSDQDHGHPVPCNTDAAAIAAGLRGINQADCTNTVGIQYSKVSNIFGALETKEAFAETDIPLLANMPYANLLKVDLAGRWADYTGSGSIWAYKGGADWDIAGGFRLRGTYSRDVRAANLSERFDKTGGVAVLAGGITVTTFSGGNPNVKPERADTFTAGAVYQPTFIPGLQMSADWYRIKINDEISLLGAQNVVNGCAQGVASLCQLITFDPVTHLPIIVGNIYVNVNQAMVRGVDFEVDYRRNVRIFGGDESIGARLFGSWLMENSQLIGTIKTDRAGQVGIQQSDGVPYALPSFKGTGSLTYSNGPYSLFLQGRFISSGTFENNLNVKIESNHVPAVFYTDLRLSYRFAKFNTELYGTVTNLFDVDPPVTPYYSAFASYAQQYNPSLYDVLGRRFVIGATIHY